MDIVNLITGILLAIASVLYAIYNIRSTMKDKSSDAFIYTSDIEITTGLLICFCVGIIIIYNEIKHFF